MRYAAVLPIVGASVGLAELFYRLTGSDRLSAIFLSGVLISAFLLGSGPAYFAAALNFVAFLFLVDPRYQWFTFGSPDDVNAMIIFAVVAVLTSALTGRVRDEAVRASARRRIDGALIAATQAFSASSDEVAIRKSLAGALAAAAEGHAYVRDGERMFEAPEGVGAPTTAGPWQVRTLRAGDADLGAAGWRVLDGRMSEEAQAVLNVLADTGAAAIARARLATAKAEAETRARTEDLRNALLSSISHDLRTPLASILASASSLRDFGASFDEPTRTDLAATIEEEALRLDAFVANLLSMTRLEAGALSIAPAPFNLSEAVTRTLERRRLADEVTVEAVPGLAPAMGDPLLFEQALGNVVENARRYAGTGQVTIGMRAVGARVEVTVADEGPGVAPEDVERIFEKFYRGKAAPRAAGTGLGLSIVRGLMQVMGGQARADNRADGKGLVVTLSLGAADQ